MDVDTGTDDATAIILAALSDKIDLIGVTTSWGNRELPITTKHTLMVIELLKMNIPVYAGCVGPIARHLYRQDLEMDEVIAYDENGERVVYHDDFHLPEPQMKQQKKHAVHYIVDTLRATEEPITFVSVGPLTNLGLALRIAPDIVRNLVEVVIMGGGIMESNMTICAEGNIIHDPEAAEILLSSGVKVTVIPLDATHRAALPGAYVEKCEQLGTPIGDFFAELLRRRIKTYNALQPLRRPNIAPIHDALCIAYLIDPGVLKDVQHVHLHISLDHGRSVGACLIDRRFFHKPENAYIALNADCDIFGRIVMETLQLQKR